MTATLRDVTDEQQIDYEVLLVEGPNGAVDRTDIGPAVRRQLLAIAVTVAICLSLIVTYAVGRNRGYNEGRDAGQVEALQKCGEGWDAGLLGNMASLTAPRGTRTVVCAVPEQLLDD